ncbi:hypothetical protein ACF0H5_021045 [Mactra antiquata]
MMIKRKCTYSRRRKAAQMELSWMIKSGCVLRMRASSHVVLTILIILTTTILLMQLVYLHGKPHTFELMLPTKTRHNAAPVARIFDKTERPPRPMGKQKVQTFRPFQRFGREHCIVRFRSNNTNSPYELLDETMNVTAGAQKYYLYRHPTKMVSKYNGNITIHVKNPGAYSVGLEQTIYLMSAFSRNLVQMPKGNTRFKQPDPGKEVRHVVLVGWLGYQNINDTLRCCLLLGNDTIVSFINQKRLVWTQVNKQPLMAVKFFCDLPKELYGEKVKGACISLHDENCLNKKFVAIEFLKKQPKDSLAVCSKIAYGQLSAQRLIEWLEIQKLVGVDKVLTYYYNLNSEAMKVLLHYYKEGFVDLRPFDYPDAENNTRYVGQKDAQPFIDEQVVLYEALERLRGYTYTAVIDVDEVIYARTSPKHNLKKFLNMLLRREPKAAGFSFRTELFITDWQNKEDLGRNMNKFWHARYLNRTRPLDDRTKNILINDRIILGSVWTHNYTALHGYKKYQVSASFGTLKHYRPCRKNWHCFLRRGYRDTNIAGLMKNIQEDVTNRFNVLLNNSTLLEIDAIAKGRILKGGIDSEEDKT